MKPSIVESLNGQDLDDVVANLEGWEHFDSVTAAWHHQETGRVRTDGDLRFSEDWSLAGPIIEHHCITLVCAEGLWYAETHGDSPLISEATYLDKRPLVAAMRAYVARRLMT